MGRSNAPLSIIEPHHLNRVRLPASRYPEYSDEYFCDRCGRDLTKRFWKVTGHSLPPLGPPTFHCVCGARFLTRRCEWDGLSASGRSIRWRGIRLLSFFSAPLILASATAYWAAEYQRHTLFLVAMIATVLCAIVAVPSIFSLLEVWDILASVWRTRVLRRKSKAELQDRNR